MSRQLEQVSEDRAARRRKLLLKAVTGGLEDAVGRAGGELRGLSLKLGDYEVLMTLRAEFPAGSMVGFVGGADVEACYIKGMNLAGNDQMKWREDKWRANGG